MHHLAKSVVCPFFQTANNYSIQCEGYGMGNRLRLSFDGKARMDSHTKQFCNNMNGYGQCPLYPVIMKQYEKKGGGR